MDKMNLGKSSTGMDANVAALLSYVLGWITGLVFFLIEKDNKFVKFHALQSIYTFGGITVLSIVLVFIPVIGWILLPFVYLAEFVIWVILLIKAYQGQMFKLPVVGEMAAKKTA